MTTDHPLRIRVQLAFFATARGVINTSYRLLYPFLPAIARGLGVSFESVALAITARSSLGIASPLFGQLAERRGRRNAMLFALLIFASGMFIIGLWPTYLALFIGLLLSGASKVIFDPAMQAYLGDQVVYQRRGLAIALTEFGWSGAYLLGVPVAGWLIAKSGWSTPFRWLGLGGLVITVGLVWIVPGGRELSAGVSSLQAFRQVTASRVAMAGLAVGLIATLANELVSIVFGVWLENRFGLQILALGGASMIIGTAELGGEGLVAGLADRLGKKRCVAIGLGLNVAACGGMHTLPDSIPGALTALFLFYLTFEFTLVTSISLMTELVPGARATTMSSNIAAQYIGHALGALLGPVAFTAPWGMQTNILAAAILDGLALLVLLGFVTERPAPVPGLAGLK
jgi:predicted MFS family arabinose efflux permease